VIEHQTCCNANADFWHEASDRILIADDLSFPKTPSGVCTENLSRID
jgi:hypothetical protein